MTSNNKTVNKCIDLLVNQREKLRDKRQNLRDRLEERWPYEEYGIKADCMFDEQSVKLDAEIKLLSKYISGMYDLIEIIEARDGTVL